MTRLRLPSECLAVEHARTLALLKAHRLDLSGGPVWNSHQECIDWTNKVAPLLRYNPEHYEQFMASRKVMLPEHISNALRMTHIRQMSGIVDQAILELENEIEPNHAPDPANAKSKDDVEPGWHRATWGKILLRAIYVVMGFTLILLMKHCLGLDSAS